MRNTGTRPVMILRNTRKRDPGGGWAYTRKRRRESEVAPESGDRGVPEMKTTDDHAEQAPPGKASNPGTAKGWHVAWRCRTHNEAWEDGGYMLDGTALFGAVKQF